MAGILESLALGLRQAGGVLSPSVSEQIAKQNLGEDQLRRQLLLAQYQRQLQTQTPEYQMKLEALKNERAFREELGKLGANPDLGKVANLATRYGKPELAIQLHKAAEDRAARFQQALMTYDARIYEIDRRMEDKESSRQVQEALGKARNDILRQRNEILSQLNDLRRQQMEMGARPPSGYRWKQDGSLEPIPGGPADKPKADVEVPTAVPPISPAVKGSLGTGPSGVFGSLANTISEALGGSLPQPKVEEAVQALQNLRIQTITMAQEAIPGRPSNYLMQQLDKLAVQPNSLLMGDERAKIRLQQTRDILQQEASRVENEILKRPQNFTPATLAKARNNFGQMRSLIQQYDQIIGSFGGSNKQPQGEWSIRLLP